MWMGYAIDRLTGHTPTNIKEAVNIQREEFHVLLHEVELASNDFRYFGEWDTLPEKIVRYESAVNVCGEYLEGNIKIENLIYKLGELKLLNIRGDFYNFLPLELKQFCDGNC